MNISNIITGITGIGILTGGLYILQSNKNIDGNMLVSRFSHLKSFSGYILISISLIPGLSKKTHRKSVKARGFSGVFSIMLLS